MSGHASGTASFAGLWVRAGAVLLPLGMALAVPMTASGQTGATIYTSYWTNPVDADGDGCVESARLNWDPDVVGGYGTLRIYERVSRRASGTSTWTVILTTPPHNITGVLESDTQSVDIAGSGPCGPYDYRIELFLFGSTPPTLLYTGDPTNQPALSRHQEESPPPTIVTSVETLGVPENGQATFGVKLSGPPDAPVTVSVRWIAGDGNISCCGGCSLPFTTSNWNVEQTVTLCDADDPDQVNGLAAIQLSGTGLASKIMYVSEIDDDVPLAIVTDTDSINVPEADPAGATFRVKLNKRPPSDVTVDVAIVGDPSVFTVQTPQVVILATEWDTFQGHDVQVTAAHDDGCDPKQATIRCTISENCSCTKDVVAIKVDDDGNCGPCTATRMFFGDDPQANPPAPNLSVPMQCYVSGHALWVQLVVTPNINTVSFAVQDIFPAGWTVDANTIDNGGVLGPTSVNWFLFGSRPVTLRYRVTPPGDATDCGVFDGTMSCDGSPQPINGVTSICRCSMHPADTNFNWRFAGGGEGVAEITSYAHFWQIGEPWPEGPNPIPIDYVTRAGFLWQVGCNGGYHYDETTACPLCWKPDVCAAGPTGGAVLLSDQTPVALDLGLLTGGTVTRSIQPSFYKPGASVHVSITVAPDPGSSVYATEEGPPAGWTVSNINPSGVWDNGSKTIKWPLYFDGAPRVFEYDATPPAGASGRQTFAGYTSFNGAPAVVTGGQTSIDPIAPSDFDGDSDVDVSDFQHFQDCFNGPNRPYKMEGADCRDADLDGDMDVDVADFLSFQGCFNGPNRPPKC